MKLQVFLSSLLMGVFVLGGCNAGMPAPESTSRQNESSTQAHQETTASIEVTGDEDAMMEEGSMQIEAMMENADE